MATQETITKAIEHLDYRVTVGDVAAEAGLPLHEAQQGLLALASDVQAHLQVSEAGEIAYVFPKNIRGILFSKSWRLRLKALWEKIWRILFYLIRISFGILLILSLVLIVVAITILVVAASSARQDDNNRGGSSDFGGGGMVFLPRIWFGPNWFWMFDFNYGQRRPPSQRRDSEMNFLEAVFSFLFGDGDPNADLEDRRWQSIASVIRANGGVVVAEQVSPFLGELGAGWSKEFEDYMVPVLSRFNGQPQVSPEGGIVYQFPELQVTAGARQRVSPPRFLQAIPRRFSRASTGQILGAIGLGSANLIGALVLGSLLQDQVLVAELGGLVAFANSIYWLLLAYGAAFLTVPLVRYFWVQRQNRRIDIHNQQREQRAEQLATPDSAVREKLAFANTLTTQTIVGTDNLAYTTETDLVEQEAENRDKIDEEWQRLLEERNAGP
jgi:hypothetical protein